jgi:hypothetical protein
MATKNRIKFWENTNSCFFKKKLALGWALQGLFVGLLDDAKDDTF